MNCCESESYYGVWRYPPSYHLIQEYQNAGHADLWGSFVYDPEMLCGLFYVCERNTVVEHGTTWRQRDV